MNRELKTRTSLTERPQLTQPSIHPAKPSCAPLNPLLRLQGTVGNRAVQGLIQTKLKIGQPGDIYEQEADWVADRMMHMPKPIAASPSRTSAATIQRKCAECASGQGLCRKCAEEEDRVQRKPLVSRITPLIQRQITEVAEEEEEATLQTTEAPDGSPVGAGIDSMRGGGQPVPDSVRTFFEPRFGYDFSRVRLHTDAQAADSARAVNARAFTVGRDVVFGAGEYAPETGEGRQLLAHELIHVVQQSSAKRPYSAAARHLIIERKEISHAHSCTEIEGSSADYISQVYDTRTSLLWAKP